MRRWNIEIRRALPRAGAPFGAVAGLCLVAACSAAPAAPASGGTSASGAATPPAATAAVDYSASADPSRPADILSEGLPRSTRFANVEFSLTGARIARQTPASYAAGGAPEPSDRQYAFLDLTASNRSVAVDIRLPDEVFQLVTDGATGLEVAAGGVDSVAAGMATDSYLAFEVPDALDLAAAVLQIGRRPDTPALLPLSGTVPASGYPIEVDIRASVVGPGELWGDPVTFDLVGLVVSKDLTVERCCPDTGPRADEDEVFVTFSLQATGPDNRYGDAIGRDTVRLLVDGVPRAAWDLPRKSSKGETIDFTASFVVPADVLTLELELGDSSAGTPGRIPIALPALPFN
jgi:hypothetical protein